MKKCLLIHSSFDHLGGAEMLSFRLIKSILNSGYTIDVLQIGHEINFNKISQWSGIEISDNSFNQIRTGVLKFYNAIMIGKKNSLLRYALALNISKKYTKKYDLIVSSFGEMPLNIDNGFQFIHAPLFSTSDENLKYLGFNNSNVLSKLKRKFYVSLSRLIAGWSKDKVEKHYSIANSIWSANEIKKVYPNINVTHSYIGAKTSSCYNESIIGDWWNNRENSVAILGRVARGKNIELAIEFINKVRETIPNIKLHIYGSPESIEYKKELDKLILNKDYINWDVGLPREKLESELAKHKWGLHCSEFEHYGISAIELQRLGCITFVPNSCGQKEVNDNPNLKFSNIEDLISKFITIHNSVDLIQVANNSRVKVVKNHTIEKHDYHMTEIFKRIYKNEVPKS